MIKPLRSVDLVAGLYLYDETETFLGVSMGPPFGPMIEAVNDHEPDAPAVKVEWRTVRIGGRPEVGPSLAHADL